MSENCNHNCGSCTDEDCAEKQELFVKPNELSQIKKVIGVVSGKGGVGKSLVTSLLAVVLNRKGYRTGIIDADITGPSIPKAFGLSKQSIRNGIGPYPAKSDTGIDVVSINLLLEKETEPVIWRGPIISSAVKQFWQEFIWENEDYLFIDMPPGTGDVALTVFQSIKLDGIIIVTSPQDLVSMIVAKAVNMAKIMNVPIIGLVENMAYFKCPNCHEVHEIFGKSKIQNIAAEYGLVVLERLPIDSELAGLCDRGDIELFKGQYFTDIDKQIAIMEERK